MRWSFGLLIAFAVIGGAAGCGSSRQTADFVPEMAADLVLPQHELLEAPESGEVDSYWLASRNDVTLGGLPGDRIAKIEFVDVHQREWLRISNGRPREYTSVYTRSRKLGVAP